MQNYVVLGLEGERRMLLVDCDAMTVAQIDPEDLDGTPAGEGDELQTIDSARKAGRPTVSGVNVAVARMQHSPSASFPFGEPQ